MKNIENLDKTTYCSSLTTYHGLLLTWDHPALVILHMLFCSSLEKDWMNWGAGGGT